MAKVIDINRKKINNNGVYIYEKVDDKYTIVKVLGEYNNKEEAIETLQLLMANEITEDDLTKIIKDNRAKDI